MEKRERFYNIDFLRFIGIIAIVISHTFSCALKSLYPNIQIVLNMSECTCKAGRWVEFFFIVSGFLIFYTSAYKTGICTFIHKKLIRLLPTLIFAILVYMILSWGNLLHYDKYINIFSLLLINNIGLTSNNSMGNIHPAWYVSVLFWTSLFYVYLRSLVNEKWFNFITALLVMFSYVFVINVGTTFAPAVYYHFINIGILRGLGGIGLGYFLYFWYSGYKNNNFSLLNKFLFTISEIYLFIFIIQNTIFHKISINNDFIYVLAFFAIICLFLIRKGLLSNILNNKLSTMLGRYVYSIFITHIIVLDLINVNVWQKHLNLFLTHPLTNITVVVIISITFGILTYHLVEYPSYKYLSKKLKIGMTRKRERVIPLLGNLYLQTN